MTTLGRPKKEIDFGEMDKLLHIQCTLEDIAGWFDCSVDTIENRVKEEKGMLFSEYAALKRAGGKIALRRKQFQKAMDGDTQLLIFLGKVMLGQNDNNREYGQPVKIEIVHPSEN
jgi:hypothetical protein